ncbi:MAG: chaperone NapD, partial [Microvirga sp.]
PLGWNFHAVLAAVRGISGPGVRAALAATPGVEIHAEAGGKLIITLETATEADIVTRMNEISLLDGVMSAALVFHQFEAAAETEAAAKQG